MNSTKSHTLTRITALLAFYVSFWSAEAQNLTIESQVVDENGVGIPFAAVGIVAKQFGTVTFEDGSFSLSIKKDYHGDTLTVSAVGYERRYIPYKHFVEARIEQIRLEEKVERLEEVIVTNKEWKYLKFGEKRKKSSSVLSFFSPKEGTTMATLFNEDGIPMFLNEVMVATGRRNLGYLDLRCMLFTVSEKGLPAEQLFASNIIGKVLDERGIVTFKLPEDFWISEPFYLGFEWVITKEQFEILKGIQEEYPLNFIDEIEEEYPDLRFFIRNQKVIWLSTQEGEFVKEIELTEEQIEELSMRNELNPGILFQIHHKKSGLKTVTGSYITEEWREYDFHALVSILASVEPK